jgi:hypothetical protein
LAVFGASKRRLFFLVDGDGSSRRQTYNPLPNIVGMILGKAILAWK